MVIIYNTVIKTERAYSIRLGGWGGGGWGVEEH